MKRKSIKLFCSVAGIQEKFIGRPSEKNYSKRNIRWRNKCDSMVKRESPATKEGTAIPLLEGKSDSPQHYSKTRDTHWAGNIPEWLISAAIATERRENSSPPANFVSRKTILIDAGSDEMSNNNAEWNAFRSNNLNDIEDIIREKNNVYRKLNNTRSKWNFTAKVNFLKMNNNLNTVNEISRSFHRKLSEKKGTHRESKFQQHLFEHSGKGTARAKRDEGGSPPWNRNTVQPAHTNYLPPTGKEVIEVEPAVEVSNWVTENMYLSSAEIELNKTKKVEPDASSSEVNKVNAFPPGIATINQLNALRPPETDLNAPTSREDGFVPKEKQPTLNSRTNVMDSNVTTTNSEQKNTIKNIQLKRYVNTGTTKSKKSSNLVKSLSLMEEKNSESQESAGNMQGKISNSNKNMQSRNDDFANLTRHSTRDAAEKTQKKNEINIRKIVKEETKKAKGKAMLATDQAGNVTRKTEDLKNESVNSSKNEELSDSDATREQLLATLKTRLLECIAAALSDDITSHGEYIAYTGRILHAVLRILRACR